MTTRQDRIRELRKELRTLEDEADAPPLTREDVKRMTVDEINANWGRVQAALAEADAPAPPAGGPVA